jgi:hypothetical protein
LPAVRHPRRTHLVACAVAATRHAMSLVCLASSVRSLPSFFCFCPKRVPLCWSPLSSERISIARQLAGFPPMHMLLFCSYVYSFPFLKSPCLLELHSPLPEGATRPGFLRSLDVSLWFVLPCCWWVLRQLRSGFCFYFLHRVDTIGIVWFVSARILTCIAGRAVTYTSSSLLLGRGLVLLLKRCQLLRSAPRLPAAFALLLIKSMAFLGCTDHFYMLPTEPSFDKTSARASTNSAISANEL